MHARTRALVVLIAVVLGLTLVACDVTSPPVTSGGFTTQGKVPKTVVVGNDASLAAVVTSPGQTVVIVLEVYDPAGVKAYRHSWNNEKFAVNEKRTFATTWSVPTTARTGSYTMRIGIYSQGSGQLLHWNANAGTFSVTAAGGSTTSSSTTTTTTTTLPSGSLPALPAGWPRTFALGSSDGAGGAAALARVAPFGFRYQYLAGGVNTGNGWATWNANGDFVTYYIADSRSAGITPVFSYYQIVQSSPGSSQSASNGVITNLNNASTMTAYYNDLKLFFQKAGAAGGMTVLHVEPDLWAFLQQKASNDDATTVPAKVGSSGQADVAGLPDNVAGFAQAIVRLRNRYAPNVLLGYHFSTWGTGNDIIYSDPSDATVNSLGVRTARFEQSMGARFDIAFTDLADRDAAFKQYQYGDGGASWYTADDYRRSTVYIGAFARTAGLRVVLWQVPMGNTKMRAENNTWEHYQDNKVEWLIGDTTRAHLNAYAQAGVVAALFGRGADGPTCACDAAGDGITNPAAINGNTGLSLSADDDGGYFKQQVGNYYLTGPPTLPT
jgi:hypothetical protein